MLYKHSNMSAHIDSEEEALASAMQLSLGASSIGTSAQTQDAEDHAAAELELAAAIEAENEVQPEYHMKQEGSEWEEEMVPVPVNQDLLTQLLDMGFSDTRARKGLVHGGSLEGALGWLGEHEDDPDIDQPYMVKKSDTIPKPPMSAEEKAKKLEDMKNKIKQRREEKAKAEKSEEIRREKERRERGQKMDETIEERQRLMRKREAERLKREKEDAAKERARLKAEIARDKEIRKANKGVLPSVLGVEGYNPSIVQYNVELKEEPSTTSTKQENAAPTSATKVAPQVKVPAATTKAPLIKKETPKATTTTTITDPTEKIQQSIATLLRYRTGGDGGQALKLLNTFIRNIIEHPDDPKYRSVNTESAAFKTKVAPLVGSLTLLKAVGFEKDETDGKLKYSGDAADPILKNAHVKLNEAEALYKQQNP